MILHKKYRAIFALILLVIINIVHGETMLRDASVQAEHFVDSPVVAKLSAGASVQVLKSEAGWMQIKAGDVSGWVRASAVEGAGAKVAPIAQIKNGRMADNNILSSTGVRGPESSETIDDVENGVRTDSSDPVKN